MGIDKQDSLDWIREIRIEDLLDGDMKMVEEFCGKETVIALYQNFPSMNIYVSTKGLVAAKRRYVQERYDGLNIKRLAITLGVSERFIYQVISEPIGRRRGLRGC